MPEKCYQAYSDWMERRYGFPLKKEWLRFTTGCVTLKHILPALGLRTVLTAVMIAAAAVPYWNMIGIM